MKWKKLSLIYLWWKSTQELATLDNCQLLIYWLTAPNLPFIVCSMKIELNPGIISPFQLTQGYARKECCRDAVEESSFSSWSQYEPFLPLPHGCLQQMWETPSRVWACGVPMAPQSFSTDFRGTPIVQFPLSLASISEADFQLWPPAPW